ncbi:hypothetical protein L6R53_10370 [Myxococcota bacterium]|nr:hypothetical protein [Myxococcota bacterium]
MTGWLPVLLLAACTTTPPDAEWGQARDRLSQALASGDPGQVSEAARAASAFEGKDPALDRLLGDALANHLLRAADGAALLKANPAPQDPAWVSAATDAALRANDRAWLGELLAAQGHELNLQHSVVEQVQRLAARERDVGHAMLIQAVRDCTLVDGRPMLGRRQVDLPVPATLERALTLLGATNVVVSRTQLVYSPRTNHERAWKCDTGWLQFGGHQGIPDPLPPKGVLVAATDGVTTGYVELDLKPQGPWATVSDDPDLVARWLQAAALLEELDGDPQAEAKVLQRYGAGLALPAGWERVSPPLVSDRAPGAE